MKSLYGHLQRWIMGALALGAVGLLVAAYWFQLDEVDEIFNENLKQVALATALQGDFSSAGPLALPQDLPRFLEPDDGLNFVTQMYDTQGAMRSTSEQHVVLPVGAQTGLAEVQLGGQAWYVYTVRTDQGAAVAGQRAQLRSLVAQESVTALIAKLLVLLCMMAGLIHLAVKRGLAPLQHVVDDIAKRSAQSLDPLSVPSYPSEIQTIARAINRLMERLGEALQVQQRFVADAAHELRTPIAVLRLQAQLLQRATSAGRRAEAERELALGIARAERLVLQLLDLSRTEPLQPGRQDATDEVDLHAVCKEVLARLAAMADQKSLALRLNSRDGMRLQGHAMGLEMMVSNLLDNAIRYTPPRGQVVLRLSGGDDGVLLEVEDSGPGIPPSERERVFDRFYRLSRIGPASDAGVGSGIGLAIVQQVVQRHQGRIALHDADGGGLKVSIRLPRTPWNGDV